MKDPIDLSSHEWESAREKPHEPFWGPGLPGAIAYVMSFLATAIAVRWVLGIGF